MTGFIVVFELVEMFVYSGVGLITPNETLALIKNQIENETIIFCSSN